MHHARTLPSTITSLPALPGHVATRRERTAAAIPFIVSGQKYPRWFTLPPTVRRLSLPKNRVSHPKQAVPNNKKRVVLGSLVLRSLCTDSEEPHGRTSHYRDTHKNVPGSSFNPIIRATRTFVWHRVLGDSVRSLL